MNEELIRALIPVVVPILIKILRIFFPKLPNVSIPVIATGAGVGGDALVGSSFDPAQGAALGLAGVGVYELAKNIKRALTKPSQQ
jgi:hypothetical protein